MALFPWEGVEERAEIGRPFLPLLLLVILEYPLPKQLPSDVPVCLPG